MSEHCNCGHEHDESCSCEPGSDLITLVDEEGAEHDFEIADVMEMDGTSYMALIPAEGEDSDGSEDPGELIILKVVAEGVEEFLEAIEDEEEFNRASAVFMQRLEEEYDFVSDEE